MAAPSLITFYQVDSAARDTSTLTTPSFTPSNGEVLIIKIATEGDTAPTVGTVSGGSQAYTSRVNFTQASQCPVAIFSAIVSGSPGSMTVSATFSNNIGWHSMVVERWGSATLASTPATVVTVSSGAPSTTINTVANDSVVSIVNADWNATAPGTPAWRSSATQEGIHDKSPSNYVAYYAHQATTTAGSQTIGMTAPNSQNATLAGIEVQGSGPSAPTVTTQAVTDIGAGTATGNGNVVSDGGGTITERGVCWDTSPNPTTSNSKATSAGTTGAFTASITGFSDGTLYYVRAYAINSAGTSYGDNVTFSRYPVPIAWLTA